jgi:hypothetical protein
MTTDNKKANHATEILKQKMILQNGLRQQNITSTERVGIQPRGRKDQNEEGKKKSKNGSRKESLNNVKKKGKKKFEKTKEKQTQKEVGAYLKAGESGGVALVVCSALWRRCHRKESRFPFAFSPPTLDPLRRCGDGGNVRDDNNNSFPDDALVLSLAHSSSPFGR